MKRPFLIAVLTLAAAAPAAAQDRRGFVWDDRPTFVFGEDLNIEIKGRVQLDGRWFDPQVDEDAFNLRTVRLGLKGELTRHVDWEIEREIDDAIVVTEENAGLVAIGAVEPEWGFGDWKDVFINWSTFNAIRVKGGRFKMPFGLEQNTSVSELDFAYRSLGSTKIAPGRDRGVMAYGELLDGSLLYEVGVFDDDGDNGELEEPRFVIEGEDLEGLGPSFATRVVVEPFRRLPLGRLQGAEVGIAYTRAYVPEGLNSLRGEDYWGYDFFEPVYVQGHRRRLGLQWDWSPGSTGLKAEWMRSTEERLGQSNRNEDLSDFIGTAWYVSGTWIITGEDKDSDVTPEKPLFRGGFGLFEIGGRYDKITFTSALETGTPFRNPRSDYLLPNGVGTWTFGGNWRPNTWAKVVANVLRQSYDDLERTPRIVGVEERGTVKDYWSGLVRLQIAF